MSDTRKVSLEDIRAMQAQGKLHAPNDGDDTLDMPDGFWDSAIVQAPLTKKQVNLRVDPDIIAFFKEQGKGHLTRMHAVLRSYVDAQNAKKG